MTVKKSKKPKKKKKTADKEEIVEVIEEERTKKVVRKQIVANKPTEEELVDEEESTETLKPFEASKQREVILESSTVVAETIPTHQVPEISSQPAEAQSIAVNIIPLTAISEEHVLTEEKEQQYEKPIPVEFKAKPSVDTNEAYQVSEELPQSVPGTFDRTFEPTFSNATRNVTVAESISVSEVHDSQIAADTQIEKTTGDTASVNFLVQEATSITETKAISKETALEEATLPKFGTAIETYKTSEGISVEEVQDLTTTENLSTEKMTTVKSKVNIDTIDHLIVQETYTDSKPGKHLPEAFVPTEVASSKFIPQQQITASVTVAPESEGEFIPNRLPPSQTAAVDITIAEGLVTEQIQTDDKEGTFKVPLPEVTTASSELILSEGITVSTTDTQMPSKELESQKTEEQKADVEILSELSVITSTIIAGESGQEYSSQELPQSKTANTAVTCLEVSSVSDVLVQESEQNLAEDAKPTMGIAEESIKPVLPLEISQVSTADVPEQFTDYPKYKTQEVTIEFETQDATEITETQVGETEDKYVKQELQLFTSSSSITAAQEELAVVEAKSMECEGKLPEFELPSTCKGKQIPSHVFPTSTTEEVTPQVTTSRLETDVPESKTVVVTQTVLDETVISQTIAADSLGMFKEAKEVKETQADVSVTINEGVTVTEILSDEKEKEYLSKDSPKQYQATVDVDGQKAANTSEILTNFFPEQFQPETPVPSQAKPYQTLVESIQILQHETGEKENEYRADVLPETKQPSYELTTTNRELNVSETYVQESESEYILTQKPIEASATSNISTQEVAIKSETEMVSHTDEIIEDEIVTGKAKKYARPLQELIVTEPTAVDFHKDLPKDIFPYEKKANIDLIPGQQLTVTEVIANETEDSYDTSKPSEKHASAALLSREVALQEETLVHINPDEFTYKSPTTDTATSHRDVIHHITQLQLTPAEKESEYRADIQPDTKVVNVEYEEGKSITVLEVQTEDKEDDFRALSMPTPVHGETDIVPCNVAIKTEIATDDSISDIQLPIPKATEAEIRQTLLEGVIQTETKAEERESQFSETLPEARNAAHQILLDETVTISSVVTGDKEAVLETAKLPQLLQAQFDVTEHTSAQTTEVQAGDTFAVIESKTADEAIAQAAHFEQHSITQSEMTAGESEAVLPKDVVPEKKFAEYSIDSIGTATTEEIVTEEKENLLAKPDKPATKRADEHIDTQPVAETTITIAENAVGEVEIKDTDKQTANITQNTFESIVESDITIGESESIFEKTEISTKTANINFNEDKSVNITQVTVADSEQQYISEVKPTVQLAVAQFDTAEALQKQEIPVHESLSDLSSIQPKGTFAEQSVQPFNAIVGSVNLLQESETQLEEHAKPDTKTAILNIPEDQPLIVHSVETAVKESTLETMELPQERRAETEIIDLKLVATQFEVFPDSSTIDITEKPVNDANANVENILLESVTHLQPLISETEGTIPDIKSPDSYNALINVEPCQSLEISQVTLGDTNEKYDTSISVNEKVAQIGVNAELQVVQMESTSISEGLDVLHPKEPKTSQATCTSSSFTSLTVSENVVHESGVEFSEKLIALSSQADTSLEPGKPVQNITEVTVQEKEVELNDVIIGEQKYASVDIDTHNVAETTEVTSQTAADDFEQKHPVENIANLKAGELESLIQQQPEICEREGEIDVTLKSTPKIAEVSLQEFPSISVSEIRTTEKETKLDEFEKPKSAQAKQNLLEKEATETSEVQSSFCLTDLTPQQYEQYSANFKQELLEGITNSQTVPIDSEQMIEEKPRPDAKQADVSLTEMTSISVQETYVEGGQQEYLSSQRDSECAVADYTPLRPLIETFTIPVEDVPQLHIADVTSSFANVQQTTLDSIERMENVVHEKEEQLESFKALDTKTANTTLIEQETIDVTEVLTQEKENLYNGSEKIDLQLATLNVFSQQPLQQHEVEASTALGELKISKPKTDEATALHTNLEAIEVSENVLHEQEAKFDTEVPDARTVDVEFLPQKYIGISETIAEIKETDFEKQKIKQEVMAEAGFFPHSAVEVAQTVSDQTISDFSYQIPQEAESTASAIPLENVIVTDLITGEKETILQEDKTPKSETVTVNISTARSVAFISETTAESKESIIPEYETPSEAATLNVLNQIPIEETEVNTSYDLEQLIVDNSAPMRKAFPTQTTLEGITQTEIRVQEKAKYIDTEYEDRRTADSSIVTTESISVTEINAQEQEADKVIVGQAIEKTSQSQVQGQHAAITEETIALQSSDIIDAQKLERFEAKANEIGPSPQYGLVVSEQRSTGELESVPNAKKPDSIKGRVLFEDVPTTPIISEIQLQEKEGKYFVVSYLNGRKSDR